MKLYSLLHKDVIYDSTAVLAGMLLTLAFAPYGWFPLAIVAPALLLFTWLDVSPARAFWRGWLFGIGFFLTGVYWIYISVYTFGNTPFLLAAFITGAFIAILALFPAFNGYLLNRYFPNTNTSKLLCAFPFIWVSLEWIRSWLFTGFPWLLLGNSQTNSPLKGYAAVFGVYGLSLFLLLSSSLLLFAWFYFKKRDYRNLFLSILTAICIWVLGWGLTFPKWTQPEGKPIQVSLIQGNIEQQVKWSPEQVQPTLDTYARLTNENWGSRIIIWPESSIPIPFLTASEYLFALDADARKNKSAVIVGVPINIPNTRDYLNAVMTLGEGKGIYAKHRLVPFGEYVPFRDYLGGLLQFMNIPMSDFIPNKDNPEPLIIDGIKIAPFICYEIAYPEQVLARDGDSNIILTTSNDGWFGKSIAQAQHLQIAQMRALETGRPILFVSNNGLTAIIKPDGQLQKAIPPFEEGVLVDKVQPMKGKTPWQFFKMDGVIILLIALLYLAIRFKKSPQLEPII